jgi:hypothetical protein
MSSGVAFLTRLSLIAGAGASERTSAAHAAALVRAYETALYARLGMARSGRPTARAKEIAGEAFEHLRRMVFKAELGAPAGAAAVFATARDHLDMARRALALRLAAEDGGGGVVARRGDDRRRLDAIRVGLRDQRWIVTSRNAIRQSRDLLGALAVARPIA